MRALVLVSRKIPACSLAVQGALLDVARFTCDWFLAQRAANDLALGFGLGGGYGSGPDAMAAALAAVNGSDESGGGPASLAAAVGAALVVRRACDDGSVQSSHLLNRYFSIRARTHALSTSPLWQLPSRHFVVLLLRSLLAQRVVGQQRYCGGRFPRDRQWPDQPSWVYP
jgi:hypothetical protein